MTTIEDAEPGAPETWHAPTPPAVAIIGGSIAGLSVAAVLGRLGLEIVVYERSRVLDQRSGAGLGMDLALVRQVTGSAQAPPHLRLGRRVVAWGPGVRGLLRSRSS